MTYYSLVSLARHKYLLSYRYTELIHDGTVEFTYKFLNFHQRRTKEQMDQAARSGKQNLVEGVDRGQTSKSAEINLLNVSKSSLEELITDYEDFLRQRGLEIWPKTDSRILAFRQLGFRLSDLRNLSSLGDLIEKLLLPENSEEAANLMLSLCHQASYLLYRQILATEKKVIEEGGYRENLYQRREEFRKNVKIK